ncbi:hypothetical protein PISMIDRAFT_86865 [Pisolithus microcarpus 441]|uniref:Uncharacterized protein n=1 Tax=Pisolithus microcarpus 441 TaxID=765257 RepID=A0A0D0AFB4_9AGAM|nr:hypothetical protein PISMIDRAFT_86865 [Pisolithus microcarpus 441]
MPETTHRKPRPKLAPYVRKPRQKPSQDMPTTSAKDEQTTSRENLTLYDWMTVFTYIDEHPGASQEDIVQHFATKKTGALLFTQSTLSRKLKARLDLEQ